MLFGLALSYLFCWINLCIHILRGYDLLVLIQFKFNVQNDYLRKICTICKACQERDMKARIISKCKFSFSIAGLETEHVLRKYG